jgi:hypothetical protein
VPAPELLAAVREVLAEHPGWGHRKVWATLRRRGSSASWRRVAELRRANGEMQATYASRTAPRRPGPVVVPEPNRRFATDLTTVWTRQDGLVAVALTVDCGCRSVLDVTATKSRPPGVRESKLRSHERKAAHQPMAAASYDLLVDGETRGNGGSGRVVHERPDDPRPKGQVGWTRLAPGKSTRASMHPLGEWPDGGVSRSGAIHGPKISTGAIVSTRWGTGHTPGRSWRPRGTESCGAARPRDGGQSGGGCGGARRGGSACVCGPRVSGASCDDIAV